MEPSQGLTRSCFASLLYVELGTEGRHPRAPMFNIIATAWPPQGQPYLDPPPNR